MKKTSRLFAVAEHLRGRRTGTTAEQLAERFGVSVRTIYRDLDSLRDAALPLQAERGRGGGYALDRAYTLPPVNLSPREAAVLVVLGRYAKALRLLPFEETLEAGLDKVRGALSASAQRELLDHVRTLQFTGVPALTAAAGVRKAVEEAFFERRTLKIRYRAPDGISVSERRVRLVNVVFERSITLLNCDDLEKNDRRQFRLDRIEHAEVIDDVV